MSLMGLVMLAGITMSNSILIVEFAHHLVKEGHAIAEAVITSCAVRLRPILMTTLATIIGLLPMALKMGEGSESYAPLAMALVGGLGFSVLVTVFIVPAGFYLAYRTALNFLLVNDAAGIFSLDCRIFCQMLGQNPDPFGVGKQNQSTASLNGCNAIELPGDLGVRRIGKVHDADRLRLGCLSGRSGVGLQCRRASHRDKTAGSQF